MPIIFENINCSIIFDSFIKKYKHILDKLDLESNRFAYLNTVFNIIENMNEEYGNINLIPYKNLPVEIRAIVPENVLAFLEYEGDVYNIYYQSAIPSQDENQELFSQIHDCLWSCVFTLYLKLEYFTSLVSLAPYIANQPKTMFPFKSLLFVVEMEQSRGTYMNQMMDLHKNLSDFQFYNFRMHTILLSYLQSKIS